MPLEENVSTRVSYKAYASGAMTANTEADTATAPGATGGFELRRISSTLGLNKDTYEAEEVDSTRQVNDYRHGAFRSPGEIVGELSPATYWDLIEATLRGTDEATISRSNTEFTSMAADNATRTFTAGASTWAAQGFRVGDMARFTGLSDVDNNSKNFQLLALAGAVATVWPAPDTMGADTSFTVDRPGRKVSPPASGHVQRLIAVEHYYSQIDVAELFTEGRMHKIGLALPASGLAKITVGGTWRNALALSGASSPYFSGPAAPTTTGITAAVNGTIHFQGSKVGILTGIDFEMGLAAEAPAVVGQDFTPEIFLGRTRVPGNYRALLQDATFLNYFKQETEVEIVGHLATTSAANSPFISFCLPRVKFNGAQKRMEGEAGIEISGPFMALRKPPTTGYDATTIVLGDSEAT